VAGRGTPATALLGKLGIAHSVLAYPHDPRHGSYGAGFPTVYCSAGRRGLELALAPADLVRAAGAVVAPIAATRHS
jgi:hypothetical protein